MFSPLSLFIDVVAVVTVVDVVAVVTVVADYVKYLGILIDKNLNWKAHIDLIALKISKTIGMIAKLRHPFLLLSSYISLLFSLTSPM